MSGLIQPEDESEDHRQTRRQKRQLWLILIVMLGSSCLGLLLVFGLTWLLRNNLFLN